MATCSFVFGSVSPDIPSLFVSNSVSEEETVGATTVATTAAASASQNICRVSTDTACYVSFGSAPNAGTDNPRYMIQAGATEYFRVSSGDKGAVIQI